MPGELAEMSQVKAFWAYEIGSSEILRVSASVEA